MSDEGRLEDTLEPGSRTEERVVLRASMSGRTESGSEERREGIVEFKQHGRIGDVGQKQSTAVRMTSEGDDCRSSVEPLICHDGPGSTDHPVEPILGQDEHVTGTECSPEPLVLKRCVEERINTRVRMRGNTTPHRRRTRVDGVRRKEQERLGPCEHESDVVVLIEVQFGRGRRERSGGELGASEKTAG